MKCRINISIDDVSPHPRSSTQVLEQCRRILKRFPDAKFTLFVPLAYWRTQGPTATSIPLEIDKFPEFCDELRGLPKESYELAYHGLHHGIPDRSNNDELKDVGIDDARVIIGKMKEIATKAGLVDDFKGILRPPAWRMSPDAFQACLEAGITTFALSDVDYALASYQGVERTVNAVFCDAVPPFKPLVQKEQVEIVYHACEWDKNYLSDSMAEELMEFLSTIEPEFVFFGGLHG